MRSRERATPSSPRSRLWVVYWGGKNSAPKMSTNTGSRHKYCFSVCWNDFQGVVQVMLERLLCCLCLSLDVRGDVRVTLRGLSPLLPKFSRKRYEHSPVVKVLRRRTELMVDGVVTACCHGDQKENGRRDQFDDDLLAGRQKASREKRNGIKVLQESMGNTSCLLNGLE